MLYEVITEKEPCVALGAEVESLLATADPRHQDVSSTSRPQLGLPIPVQGADPVEPRAGRVDHDLGFDGHLPAAFAVAHPRAAGAPLAGEPGAC